MRSSAKPKGTVRAIRPAVDADLVAALTDWLEDAKAGRLIGVVLLGNRRGDEVQHHWVGEMPLGVALVTMEQLKLKALKVLRDD